MSQPIDDAPEYARIFIEGLKETGIGVVTALPESLLKSVYRLCAADPDIRYIPVTNEGEMPGICAGSYVVGAKALMIMENSGLRQASEPIARFSFRSGIPMVMALNRGFSRSCGLSPGCWFSMKYSGLFIFPMSW